MDSLPSRLFRCGSDALTGNNHVNQAAPIPSTKIGPASQHLQDELLEMYWQAVERELPRLLLTFNHWQSNKEMSELLPDERDLHIHGYDTFVDQVSDVSRQFHRRNKSNQETKGQKAKKNKKKEETPPSYDEVLRDRGWDIFADLKSQRIKGTIRASLREREILNPEKRRARMVLQSAQFLDIDKIIEHRDLEEPQNPPNAQMKVACYNDRHQPVFVPQHCLECKGIIRGCSFVDTGSEGVVICEACYWATPHGDARYMKQHKHCCLPTALTSEISRKLCCCSTVRRRDNNGHSRSLWPIDPSADEGDHLNGSSGRVRCGLYTVTDLLAEAKYASIRYKVGKSESLAQLKRKNPTRGETPKPDYAFDMAEPNDVPGYVRPTVANHSYDDVRMAIRFGPLVFEIGTENTMCDILITSRDPPSLQANHDPRQDITKCLLLTGEADRLLLSQNRPRSPKRFKAFMKQVVGGAFCGYFESDIENQLIDAFIHESNCLNGNNPTSFEGQALLEKCTKRLLLRVKVYLTSRVQAYISSFTASLLNPNIQPEWEHHENKCGTFFDRIPDRNLFSSLFPPQNINDQPRPLYLMSFVCRLGSDVPTQVSSKYDVPNGFTEEYLLKSWDGRCDESDIIDTLTEYWTDWGGFEGPIYPYQDAFPWDCTEAYDRYPGKCGHCNISKHVLAFPFDSWSIASLHLARGRELYPRSPTPTDKSVADGDQITGLMTDSDWFKNRLTILLGQDSLLAAAVAMSKSAQFRTSTDWLHTQLDQTMDRLKLGGIHRAQPYSHHFEKGAYHRYFVADWALLARPLRVVAYEKLRNRRMIKMDVGTGKADDAGDAAGCGTGVFVCGAAGAGCAAGSPGMAGDTCGSGCVSSCLGAGDGDGDGGGCGGCGG